MESQAGAAATLKAELTKIDARLEDLPAFNCRIAAAEEALKATNQRMDASLQTLSARIAEMNQLPGAIDAKVAVARAAAGNGDAAAAGRRKAGGYASHRGPISRRGEGILHELIGYRSDRLGRVFGRANRSERHFGAEKQGFLCVSLRKFDSSYANRIEIL